MMLRDVVNNPMEEQHIIRSTEEGFFSSPIGNQVVERGEGKETLPEALAAASDNSDCSGENIGNTYDGDAALSSPFSSLPSMDPSTLAALLEGPLFPDTTFTNIDYSSPLPPPPSISATSTASISTDLNVDPFALNGYPNNGCYTGTTAPTPDHIAHMPSLMPPPALAMELGNNMGSNLSAGYMGIDPLPTPSSSFMDPMNTTFFPGHMGLPCSSASSAVATAGDGLLPGNMLMGCHGGMVSIAELGDYRSDFSEAGLLGTDGKQLQTTYGPGDVQYLSGSCGSPSRLSSELTTYDESTFKVGRLSPEERKLKIHRYIKKRNERNFSKKIKYACRKTLADSRPRVRGRFAKNDEFCEVERAHSSNHDDDYDEDLRIKDDAVDSSDIFTHLNSFKCNYTVESWI